MLSSIEVSVYHNFVMTNSVFFSCFQIVLEALFRLSWQAFIGWLSDSDVCVVDFAKLGHELSKMKESINSTSLDHLMELPQFKLVFDLYQQYLDVQQGPMKEFWISYMRMILLLLRFIRASREGDWVLHLACIREMLPWVFAYDKCNYARYLPVYWVEMSQLEEKHPDAYEQMMRGEFTVQRGDGKFTRIPVDQAIEQTINRSTKCPGGIVGFTQKPSAVKKWLVTAHTRASVLDELRRVGDPSVTQTVHKECRPARMAKDESDVVAIKETITVWGNNPFDGCENLRSLASGVVASEEIVKDLLGARDSGENALKRFMDERIYNPKEDFFSPIKRSNLKAFDDAFKRKKSTATDKETVIKADGTIFARLLVIAQTRDMDMKEVLSHELGDLPWALSSVDGSLKKTSKASLQHLLEKNIKTVANESLCDATTLVIDAMGFIQEVVAVPKTFGELGSLLLHRMVSLGRNVSRIDFVGEIYNPTSIKHPERERREVLQPLRIEVSSGCQKCPLQWRRFLTVDENKASLLAFLAQEWTRDKYAKLLETKTLFVTTNDKCQELTSNGSSVFCHNVPSLTSNHEEADTRMFQHCLHAAQDKHKVVIIKSSDTDVEILACHFQSRIPAKILLLTGTANHARLLNIPAMMTELGEDICNVLPSLHAITGCDSVSCFAGRGKKEDWNLLWHQNHTERHLPILAQPCHLIQICYRA